MRTVLQLAPFALFGAAHARSAGDGQRRTVEAAPESAANRIVVVEGDRRTARLVNELEQELRASSYVVVRVPKVAFEPGAMVETWREAHAWRGIVLSDDGSSAAVVAASGSGGRTLHVYAQYALDLSNRLARRRQWISLVERLRASAEQEENEANEEHDEKDLEDSMAAPAISAIPNHPANAATAKTTEAAASPKPDPVERSARSDRLANSLGASVALGYVTGRTGLSSHLLLTGYHPLSPRISLAAHLLWPMVQGESTSGGLRSRVWTFSGDLGLMGDLGRASWRAQPFIGATAGLQFLLAYVDRPEHAITDIYRVASLIFDAHFGVRLLLRRETWLILQVSGGRAVSLATQPGAMTDSLADSWSVRSAVGLLMAL